MSTLCICFQVQRTFHRRQSSYAVLGKLKELKMIPKVYSKLYPKLSLNLSSEFSLECPRNCSQKCSQNCFQNYSQNWLKLCPKMSRKSSRKCSINILYVTIIFTLFVSGTKNFSQRAKFRKPLNAVKNTWESWKSWKSLFLIGTMKWLQLLCAVVCGHLPLERIANHYICPQNCQKLFQTFSTILTPELT